MSTAFNGTSNHELVFRRLRKWRRLRRRRREIILKKVLEVVGWLTAILIFVYASHAAFAQ